MVRGFITHTANASSHLLNLMLEVNFLDECLYSHWLEMFMGEAVGPKSTQIRSGQNNEFHAIEEN